MKKTQRAYIFPLNKGLDKTSIPGTQDPRALKTAKNIVLGTRPSLTKRPGQRRIPYIGNDDGVQAACHFFAPVSGYSSSEVIRARKGRLEALRNGVFEDLGISFSPNDVVTFERYSNILIIHFENTAPYYYTIGGTPTIMPILASHLTTPPSFSRNHDSRLFYSGRPSDPHKVWASAPNNAFDYTLRGGGFSMRVREGDGDPVGITGISPPLRGDLYISKWSSIYRMTATPYGYAIIDFSSEVGCVHHNTMCVLPNDLIFTSEDAVHALSMTDKYGAAEEATLTYPIYEYFQESVNWSNARNMKAVYDQKSSVYLLSYTSAASSVNNKVLGINVKNKEFFEYEDIEYPAMCKYFDFGRQKILVADEERGLCVFDSGRSDLEGDPVNMEIKTGVIFPLKEPKAQVNFTKGWLMAKPTIRSVEVEVSYYIDGKFIESHTLDTIATGDGSLINEDSTGGVIGTDDIGYMSEDMVILEFEMQGEGASIQFQVKQEPADGGEPNQPCELFGIVYEFDYIEDTEQPVRI